MVKVETNDYENNRNNRTTTILEHKTLKTPREEEAFQKLCCCHDFFWLYGASKIRFFKPPHYDTTTRFPVLLAWTLRKIPPMAPLSNPALFMNENDLSKDCLLGRCSWMPFHPVTIQGFNSSKPRKVVSPPTQQLQTGPWRASLMSGETSSPTAAFNNFARISSFLLLFRRRLVDIVQSTQLLRQFLVPRHFR